MNIVLLPAVKLMQQLRLLPKFLLVSLIFIVPLALVVSLLFNELQKSLTQTQQEQDGLQSVSQIDALIMLSQQYRAQHYIALSSQRHTDPIVTRLGDTLGKHIDQLDGTLSSDTATIAAIKTTWQDNLKETAAKAKDAYAKDSAMIAQLRQLKTAIIDQTHLRLDPESQTHYLMLNMLDTIPAIASDLYTIGGRGGAYIDTGLLEPNEDVQLTSTLKMTERNVLTLKQAYTTMSAHSDVWKTTLAPALASIGDIDTFIDRASDEVLKSFNQSSGAEFMAAAQVAAERLNALSGASASLLATSLEDRHAQYELRRDLIMAVIAFTLLAAIYLLAGFYVAFSREVTSLTEAVNLAANGDLRPQPRTRGKDEIAGLSHAFTDMNAGLTCLIAAVRNSVDHITAASTGIASGNTDLATRTQSQTSSLDATALLMQQMHTTVHNNADHAEHAMQLARSASNTALKGGEAVNDVVNTMQSIRDSSQKITDIITVIDSIAFQTNILALNAAVEAARAGEQGRGFAVVASEVRSLAQRSATAAKEIKTLINDSVNEVDTGSKQVSRAGQTMNDIVTSVRQVTAIIEEISASSKKQSSDITHISEAVTHIGAITEKNIHLVEQASQAANSLQQQATELNQAVGVFKLEDAHEDASLSTIYTASEQIGHHRNPALTYAH